MNNQGVVNPSTLLDLFQELVTSSKFFRLTVVKDNGIQKEFIYQKGTLVFVQHESFKGLERYLIGQNILTFEQAEELIKYKKESGMPLEQLIVQADILTESALKDIWAFIARDSIVDLFTCENGQYKLEELLTAESGSAVFNLSDLANHELEIHTMLTNLSEMSGLATIYRLVHTGKALEIQTSSNEGLKFLSSVLNGKNSINDILHHSIFSTSQTLQLLKELKSTNQIIDIKEKNQNLGSVPQEHLSVPVENKSKIRSKDIEQNINVSENINGSLSFLSLVEVIQTLFNTKKTGTLTIDVPDGPGVLNILKGELVGANYGAFKNKDAFYKLVTFKDGNFSFVAGDAKFVKEMDIPTMSLLMEAMRLIDESSKSPNGNSIGNINSNSSNDNVNSKSFMDEAPKASRTLKRKESRLSFLIKLIVFILIAVYFITYLFIIKPENDKKLAFEKQLFDNENLVNNSLYLNALENWIRFSKSVTVEHPEWEIDINEHKKSVLEKYQKLYSEFEKDIETANKAGDFSKAIEKLNGLQKIIPNDKEDVNKYFEKSRQNFSQLKEKVYKLQKETDYKNWRANIEDDLKRCKELIRNFEHEDALERLEYIKSNLDKNSDHAIIIDIEGLKKIISERESNIKKALLIVKEKNVTFQNKIDAYEIIIQNAGSNQTRGIQANKDLLVAKEKMSSYQAKYNSILQAKSKETSEARIQLIEQLQKDASSKEETLFLEREKEKIFEKSKKYTELFKEYQGLIDSKEYSKAFTLTKTILENNWEEAFNGKLLIPFYIDNQDSITVKINEESVQLPYLGMLDSKSSITIVAQKIGCKTITEILNKEIKSYNIKLDFLKAELWAIDFKGDLNIAPEISLNGKGLVLANRNNYEMLLLKNGSRVWQRQINDPNKVFKRSSGADVIIGDDDFWNVDSPPIIFENYIGISGKNAELFVLNEEDGNHLLRYDIGFYSKCSPLIARLPLLGNRVFVYTGNIDGSLISVAVDDQSVRLQEKVPDNSSILGLYTISEQSYVVITEQNIYCYAFANNKLKWSKNLISKAKGIFKIGSKIYVRQIDGLLEINEVVENWKLITFPIGNIQEVIKNDKSLIVKGDGKIFSFNQGESKFEILDSTLLNCVYWSKSFSLVKYDHSIQCLNSKNLKSIWSTEMTKDKINKLKIIDNYLFFKEGERLHAIFLD